MLREQLRTRFVEELVEEAAASGGGRLDPAWAAAFRAVPREVFVPAWFTRRAGEPGWWVVAEPDQTWLEGVYSASALITQIDGDPANLERARARGVRGAVTSSSSAPSLMAGMLQALAAELGHSVLEIGTGTGYNAALLSHRLGAEQVTSLDVDDDLVATARRRLAGLGYEPQLVVGDGAQGCPGRGPFDRIIATVALARVPSAWLAQTAPGGRIVVPLDLGGRGGLVAALDVTADHVGQGRFLPGYGGFMSLRAHQLHAHQALSGVNAEDGEPRQTPLPIEAATDSRHPFEFMAGLMTGGYDWMGFTPAGGGPVQNWLAGRDGSWACHSTDATGRHTVRQGGPVQLWDRIEAAHREWDSLGRPSRDRFGLTVAGAQHTLWLDTPEGTQRWTLPDPA